MPDFASLLKQGNKGPRVPPRVIALPPSAWADEREDKPREPVKIGIRLISEQDTQVARSEAAKRAVELVPAGTEDERIEAYNSALIRFAASFCACSPIDAEQPFFIAGEMELGFRLTPEGVRRIWHESEALHLASNPSIGEIDDEGLAHLFAMLHRGVIEMLDKPDALRVRRLLESCRVDLDEFESRSETAG